jgi:nucleoside-diphosphate-sugar epimerase
MKVLVTGATGVYGRGVVERLVRAGHEVVAMARNPPRALPSGATFSQGDVAEYAHVRRAMEGCEVVAHMAFVVAPLKSEDETRRINLGGTQNVLDAIADTGARRLVFVSSAMSYGANPDNPPLFTEQHEQRPAPDYIYGTCKKEAEAMIRASGVEAVMARTAVTVGRHTDNLIVDIFGAPAIIGIKGVDTRYQLVHQDDVGRFVAFACEQGPPGAVNVAPPDFVSLREIAEILGKPFVEVSEAQALKGVEFAWKHDLADITPGEIAGVSYMPRMAVQRLHDEWGFACTWSTRDGLYDLRRAVAGTTFAAKRRIDLPWRVRYPHITPGELDETQTGVDHPSWRAAARDTAPLATLPLTTHLYVLHAALKGALNAVGAEPFGAAAATAIDHRLYVNEDALARLFAIAPWRRRVLAAGYAREVARVSAWSAHTLELAADPASLPDASLESVMSVVRDDLAWLWSLALVGAVVDGDRDVSFDELLGGSVVTPAPTRAARAQAEATVVRLRHALKGLLVERARRAGVEGAFPHLTWDELLGPPADVDALAERRAAELAAAAPVPRRVSVVGAESAIAV